MSNFFNPKNIVFSGWAVILFVGFVVTHFYQDFNINWVWLVLSILGLGLMYKYMPFNVPVLKNTYLNWAGIILFGMFISFLVFLVEDLFWLIGYLGVFWLMIMGIGHLTNKPLYPSQKGFIPAGLLQILAGVACILYEPLLTYQYLIAAVASSVGMLLLIDWKSSLTTPPRTNSTV